MERHPINDLKTLYWADHGKHGSGLVARCPFCHHDTPSLLVDREAGLYRCSACDRSGEVLLGRPGGGELLHPAAAREDEAEGPVCLSLLALAYTTREFFADKLLVIEDRGGL